MNFALFILFHYFFKNKVLELLTTFNKAKTATKSADQVTIEPGYDTIVPIGLDFFVLKQFERIPFNDIVFIEWNIPCMKFSSFILNNHRSKHHPTGLAFFTVSDFQHKHNVHSDDRNDVVKLFLCILRSLFISHLFFKCKNMQYNKEQINTRKAMQAQTIPSHPELTLQPTADSLLTRLPLD